MILVSCNTQKKKESTDDPEGFQYAEMKSQQEAMEELIYAFPSPGDMLGRFDELGMTYRKELLNPASSAQHYISSKAKAMNLGVYIADLAFLVMFSRISESADYLEATMMLSSDLNISNQEFEFLIEGAKNNMNNRDSIVAFSNELFYSIVEFFENNQQNKVIALIASGAYIEAMHIVFQSVNEYSPDNELIRQLTELQYPMKNLLDHAKKVTDDPDVDEIIEEISSIMDTFNQLETMEGETKITQDEPGVISLTGSDREEMDERSFNELKRKVEDFRTSIVKIQAE